MLCGDILRRRLLHAVTGIFVSTVSILSIPSCSTPETPPERALYEWRPTVNIRDAAYRVLDSLQASRLYIRFFDVQWDEASEDAVPRSTARFTRPIREVTDVVPTVYITNETMRKIRSNRIDTLAARIVHKIEQMLPEVRRTISSEGDRFHSSTGEILLREIQIDCDWTATSRTPYFVLLRRIDELLPEEVTLSATIRLHQVKYRVETGTPPVDRGLLMAYNTGEVTDPKEENSIVEYEVVKQYLGELDEYPLPLDIALPIFAWGIRFHFNRFASIIPEVTAGELAQRGEFRQVAQNRFIVRQRTDLRGEQLERGDLIRTEESKPEEVLRVAELISGALGRGPGTVILYRYDPQIFERHETARLLPLYHAFD
jgi:hypothetical protein